MIHQDPKLAELLIAEMEENGADSGLEEGFGENDPAAVAMAAFYVDARRFAYLFVENNNPVVIKG